jgi:hypothetical protein
MRTRRTIVVATTALVLGVVAGSVLTALAVVSHYRAEHRAALRERAEHATLVSEASQSEAAARSSQKTIKQLNTKLNRTRRDLGYAVSRWDALKQKTSGLKTTVASLRQDVSAAKASADTQYRAGYDDGYSTALDDMGGAGDGSTITGDCDPNYEGACVPTDVGDVDCGDLLETDFYVVGDDVDGLDGDGDGIACESY